MRARRWLVLVTSLAILVLMSGVGATTSTLVDQENSADNTFQAWTATQWVQTTQADFESGNLSDVDTAASPGDASLGTNSDTVTDTFTDETKIASKSNLVVTGGQVELTAGSGGTETLRPDAAGNETGISSQYPVSGAHWDKVNEAAADDSSTYVYTASTSYQRDLYSISPHAGSGTIDSVTVYFRFANSAAYGTTYAIAYNSYASAGLLKTVGIANGGNITDTVIDTLQFDGTLGATPNMIPVSNDVYAVAYGGDGDDGFLKTVEMAPNGQITDTVIDTLEFDISQGMSPNIIHVSGNVYAIAYQGKGDDGFLKTVEIATGGNITDSVIDTLEFDTVVAYTPNIIPISGDVYAIAYCGDDGDGFLKTVEIATNGQITDTVIDTLEFTGTMNIYLDAIHVSGDVYAIVYDGYSSAGYLETVEIYNDGQIKDTVNDTLEIDNLYVTAPEMIPVSGDVYAIAYQGNSGDGYLKTVEIATNGQITDAVIDTLEFDTSHSQDPSIIPVSGDVYAVAYEGWSQAHLKTLEIATDGQITDAVIDTLELDADNGQYPNIIPLTYTPGSVYARAALRTHGTVYTGSEESTANDTFVTKSYQWTQNPNTTSAWTWDEIDALQIGVDLKTGAASDSAACTQVYVVVDYSGSGYDSPGTLTSTNLLSGEAVASIDSFDYGVSSIPSGTSLKVQFSQDNADWYSSAGAAGGWDTLSQGTNSIDLSGLGWSGANFYYRMEFTSDGTGTPVLDSIAVDFLTYYASGTIASQVLDTGVAGATWDELSWDETLQSNTDLTFEVRASDTSFLKDAATPSWISVGGGSPVTSGLPSGRYIQWRGTLTTSDTSKTPALHEVTAYYW